MSRGFHEQGSGELEILCPAVDSIGNVNGNDATSNADRDVCYNDGDAGKREDDHADGINHSIALHMCRCMKVTMSLAAAVLCPKHCFL